MHRYALLGCSGEARSRRSGRAGANFNFLMSPWLWAPVALSDALSACATAPTECAALEPCVLDDCQELILPVVVV